jgi:hypothetical protein
MSLKLSPNPSWSVTEASEVCHRIVFRTFVPRRGRKCSRGAPICRAAVLRYGPPFALRMSKQRNKTIETKE